MLRRGSKLDHVAIVPAGAYPTAMVERLGAESWADAKARELREFSDAELAPIKAERQKEADEKRRLDAELLDWVEGEVAAQRQREDAAADDTAAGDIDDAAAARVDLLTRTGEIEIENPALAALVHTSEQEAIVEDYERRLRLGQLRAP